MNRILALMRVEAKPFADSSEEAVAKRKALPDDQWFRTYFPHYMTSPSSLAHVTADTLVEEKGIIIGLLWARGFGKTVRALLRRVRRILEKKSKFMIVAGRDEDVACDKMDMIKLELKENPRLRQDYGENIGPRAGSNEDSDWIACDTRVWARGIGQSCRGTLYGPHRPDDFLGDDLEDDVLARSKDREKNLWDWLFSGVFPALEKGGTEAYFEVLLNKFPSRHCLAVKFRDSSEKVDPKGRPICRYIEFPAETEERESAWPERWSTDELRRMESIMGSNLYRREMLLKDEDGAESFKPSWIKIFVAAHFDRSTADVRVGVDCSATAKETSDYKAIVVLARPHGSRDELCLHAWLRKTTPEQFVMELFRVWDVYLPPWIACESNGFQTLIWPLVEANEDLLRRAQRMTLRPWESRANKEDRILQNQGMFEAGCCHFDLDQGDQRILVDQFLDFGQSGIHDDGPDAWDIASRQFPRIIARVGGRSENELFRVGERRTNYGALVSA